MNTLGMPYHPSNVIRDISHPSGYFRSPDVRVSPFSRIGMLMRQPKRQDPDHVYVRVVPSKPKAVPTGFIIRPYRYAPPSVYDRDPSAVGKAAAIVTDRVRNTWTAIGYVAAAVLARSRPTNWLPTTYRAERGLRLQPVATARRLTLLVLPLFILVLLAASTSDLAPGRTTGLPVSVQGSDSDVHVTGASSSNGSSTAPPSTAWMMTDTPKNTSSSGTTTRDTPQVAPATMTAGSDAPATGGYGGGVNAGDPSAPTGPADNTENDGNDTPTGTDTSTPDTPDPSNDSDTIGSGTGSGLELPGVTVPLPVTVPGVSLPLGDKQLLDTSPLTVTLN